MEISQDDIERFFAKVRKDTGEDSCWIWEAVRNPDGYGNFKLNGTMIKAHRVSYTIHNGPIPDGLHVLHRCDTPACVRPKHLFLGTHRDNMIDREAKGRGHKKNGESNGRSKLTLKEAWQIRDLVKCKLFNQIQIGRMYDISNVVVSKIHKFQLWTEDSPYANN